MFNLADGPMLEEHGAPLRDPIESLADLFDGTWGPVEGSLGAVLLAHADDRSGAERRRDLEEMVRVGVEREGIWWVVLLDTAPTRIRQHDLDWVLDRWRRFAQGRDPWPNRIHRG